MKEILKQDLLNDSILHVDVAQEGLIIVHYLCSLDEETVALKEDLLLNKSHICVWILGTQNIWHVSSTFQSFAIRPPPTHTHIHRNMTLNVSVSLSS